MSQRRALAVAGSLTALVIAAVLVTGAQLGAFGVGRVEGDGPARVEPAESWAVISSGELTTAVEAAAPATIQAFHNDGSTYEKQTRDERRAGDAQERKARRAERGEHEREDDDD